MTLIIGVLCSDGVVIGADGAATLGSLGGKTIIQSVKKLKIINDKLIFGFSGHVGLGQQITGEIEELWRDSALRDKKPHEAMGIMRDKIFPPIKRELDIAAQTRGALGNTALNSAICFTVAAFPLSGNPHLIHFNETGAPEMATRDLPFIAIGSGQIIADPFIAFLKDIFWENSPPSVALATSHIYWALEHAIKTNPGGVAEPIQITVLESRGGTNWKARELEHEELLEHEEYVGLAKLHLATFGSLESDAETAPSPPSRT